jgi:hypothetical protein
VPRAPRFALSSPLSVEKSFKTLMADAILQGSDSFKGLLDSTRVRLGSNYAEDHLVLVGMLKRD